MKHIVRSFLFNVFALWFTGEIFPGLRISGSWQMICISGFVLCLLMLIIKPMLKILFIPINILTFGIFSWCINVIVIYLLTLLIAQVEIVPWTFPGISAAGFIIPSIQLSYIASLITATILITLFSNILHTVSED